MQVTFEIPITHVLAVFLLIDTKVVTAIVPNGWNTCAKMLRSKLVERTTLKVHTCIESGKRPIDREFTNVL